MGFIDLSKLKKEIPCQWRIQSCSKNSATATCVSYIDARDVMNILDEVAGPENWKSDYKEIKGHLYAGIGIRVDTDSTEWVWKWDCGTESNTEKEKGEASDAFKRAAVKWGVGRFLYDIPIQFVKTNEPKNDRNYPYPVDDRGNKIKDLTLHLNKKIGIKDVTVKNEVKDELTTEQKQEEVKQKIENAFIKLKNDGKSIHDYTNLIAEYLNKLPFLQKSEWFTKMVEKHKPDVMNDEDLMEESVMEASK